MEGLKRERFGVKKGFTSERRIGMCVATQQHKYMYAQPFLRTPGKPVMVLYLHPPPAPLELTPTHYTMILILG